jgi:hypothetical protein
MQFNFSNFKNLLKIKNIYTDLLFAILISLLSIPLTIFFEYVSKAVLPSSFWSLLPMMIAIFIFPVLIPALVGLKVLKRKVFVIIILFISWSLLPIGLDITDRIQHLQMEQRQRIYDEVENIRKDVQENSARIEEYTWETRNGQLVGKVKINFLREGNYKYRLSTKTTINTDVYLTDYKEINVKKGVREFEATVSPNEETGKGYPLSSPRLLCVYLYSYLPEKYRSPNYFVYGPQDWEVEIFSANPFATKDKQCGEL